MTACQYRGPKSSGVNLDRFTSTAEHELGTVVEGVNTLGHYGRFKYVKFVDAVTYKQWDAVTIASASQYSVTNDRSGGSALAKLYPVGVLVSENVPAQNDYGWVQTSGICKLTMGSASVIAGDELKPDSSEDGDCDEATAGTDENLVATALDTIADNAAGLVMLMIRGG